MEKKIATFISYMAHPLVIPILGLLVISNSGTYAAEIDLRYRQFIYLSVFIFTLLLPAALIPLFYYFGLSSNLHFSERRERLIPLYLTLIFYLASYFFIKQLPVSVVYQRFIFAACISMILLTALCYFWKISAHLVGWGGLTGLILMLSVRFNSDLMLFLIVSVFLSGLIAYSRLKLAAHTPAQVYSGFLLGLSVMVIVFILK